MTKLTSEICLEELELIDTKITILNCEKANWMIATKLLSQGKDVFEHAGNFKSVDKGKSPSAFFIFEKEIFTTREELQEKLLEAEIQYYMFEELINSLDKGKLIMYNSENESYRSMEMNTPLLQMM